MSIETFAHYRESAHHHGRHLDTMLWNIIRTVLLLGSIILAGATQVSSLNFTLLDGFLILLPLILAFFLLNFHSLGSRPLLVPHPDVVSGSPRLDDPGRAHRAHRYCMDRAFEENRARKHSIMFSVASVGATLGASGMWLGVQTSQPSPSDLILYWFFSALFNAGLFLWFVVRLWGVASAAAERTRSEHLLREFVIDIEGSGTDVANIDAITKRVSSRLRSRRWHPPSARTGAGAASLASPSRNRDGTRHRAAEPTRPLLRQTRLC